MIGLLCIGIIYFEIYSLRLYSREFSLLGSQFICSTVPDSSWHVHVCMQQIEFHLCTEWKLSSISETEILWRQKSSLAELNFKEIFLLACSILQKKRKGQKQSCLLILKRTNI